MRPPLAGVALITLALALVSSGAAGRQGTEVDALVNEGQRLMNDKNYSEALKRFRAALAISPDGTGSLYNGGLAAYLGGDFKSAAQLWERLAQVNPNDWEAQAKLVQAYQALGDQESRNRHRDRLFAMRRAGLSTELSKQDSYRRDQFEAAGQKVLVFENFELKGDWAVLYTFIVLRTDKPEEDYHFSLGSYELTNKAAHELGEIGPGHRLFHLDIYFQGGSHATLGFFKSAPAYEIVRAQVMKVMSEGVKSGSGLSPTRDEATPGPETTTAPTSRGLSPTPVPPVAVSDGH